MLLKILQNNQEKRILCPECEYLLAKADVDASCKGIKVYCKKCKKERPLIVPKAGEAS